MNFIYANICAHACMCMLGLRDQVGDMKTEHMITCLSKDEELERLKLMHQEDLSSLNMSMQEMLNGTSLILLQFIGIFRCEEILFYFFLIRLVSLSDQKYRISSFSEL